MDKYQLIMQLWENLGDKDFMPSLNSQDMEECKRLLTNSFRLYEDDEVVEDKELGICRKYLRQLLGIENSLDLMSIQKAQKYTAVQKNILSSRKFKLDEQVLISNILNHVIEYGNQRNVWDNLIFTFIDRMVPETPFVSSKEDAQQIIVLEKLYQAYENDLFSRTSGKHTFSKFDHARLCFSLIMDSYLMNSRRLMSVYEDTRNKKFHYQAGFCFVEIIENEVNAATRWPISPRSEVCLSLMDSFYLDTSEEDIFEELKQYISYLGFKENVRAGSLKGLLKWFQLRVNNHLPGIVFGYINKEFKSYSLHSSCTNSLFQTNLVDRKIKTSKQLTDRSHKSVHSEAWKKVLKLFGQNQRSTDYEQLISDGEKIADKLMSCIFQTEMDIDQLESASKNDDYVLRDKLKRKLNAEKTDLLLLEYALKAVNVELNSKGHALAPTTIRERVSALHDKLISVTDMHYLLEFDATERGLIYFEVVDLGKSDRHQNSLRYFLKLLEDYIVDDLEQEPVVDYEELFDGVTSSKSSVNSMVITFDQYDALFRYLENKIKDINQRGASCNEKPLVQKLKMMQCLLIIGFKLGTRVSEALYFKATDYFYSEEGSIIEIRPSINRGLKNIGSIRQLRLKEFLDQHELRILDEWFIEHHDGKHRSENHYLFSFSYNFTSPISRFQIIDELMQLLRTITGIDELKFHHLRHSFATWNFLSIVSSESQINYQSYFDGHPKTQEWLGKADALKESRLGYTGASIRYVGWLESKIGHVSIETTLENYIHFMDVVLLGFMCRDSKGMKASSLNYGLKKRSLERYTFPKDIAIALKIIRKRSPLTRVRSMSRIKNADFDTSKLDLLISPNKYIDCALWEVYTRESSKFKFILDDKKQNSFQLASMFALFEERFP